MASSLIPLFPGLYCPNSCFFTISLRIFFTLFITPQATTNGSDITVLLSRGSALMDLVMYAPEEQSPGKRNLIKKALGQGNKPTG